MGEKRDELGVYFPWLDWAICDLSADECCILMVKKIRDLQDGFQILTGQCPVASCFFLIG